MLGLHSAAWILSGQSYEWGLYWPHDSPAPPGNERFGAKRLREPIDYGAYITTLNALMKDKWKHVHGCLEPWRERQKRVVAQGAQLATVDDWANEVDYIVRRVGPDHAAIGLELMSGGNWLRDFDATSYPQLTAALRARGRLDETVLKILGENWLRVLDATRVH